jgi:hypothetical protein
MQDRIATTRSALAMVARLLPCIGLGIVLLGCASGDGDGPGALFLADAGKYNYHTCEQLAAAAKKQSGRQRELKELIDKAEQGAGGQIVSLMAYRSDYVAVNEDLRVIESTTRSKNCQTPSTGQSTNAIR